MYLAFYLNVCVRELSGRRELRISRTNTYDSHKAGALVPRSTLPIHTVAKGNLCFNVDPFDVERVAAGKWPRTRKLLRCQRERANENPMSSELSRAYCSLSQIHSRFDETHHPVYQLAVVLRVAVRQAA